MKSSHAIRNLTEALKLPLGHYDRINAQKTVSKIYSKVRDNEKILREKMRKSRIPIYFEKPEYFDICQSICHSLFLPGIKKIVFQSPDVDPSAGGHYILGEIHIKYCNTDVLTILHELTHHIERCEKMKDDHGDIFVEFENLAFEAFISWYRLQTLDNNPSF